MAPDISEIMSDFQNICDDYVERMCTQTIYSEFGEVYTKLYDLKTSMAEILAAKKAGATRVLIPEANWNESFSEYDGIAIIKVKHIKEVIDLCIIDGINSKIDILSAKGKE